MKGVINIDNREIINRFFVRTFNRILSWEERAMGTSDVTVGEVHIIEAVDLLTQKGENTMKNIAAEQSLSAGACSIAVNNLVNKGYLVRENGKDDRRKVFIFLTDKAKKIEEKHRAFHDKMISSIERRLSEDEWNALAKSLDSMEEYFTEVK